MDDIKAIEELSTENVLNLSDEYLEKELYRLQVLFRSEILDDIIWRDLACAIGLLAMPACEKNYNNSLRYYCVTEALSRIRKELQRLKDIINSGNDEGQEMELRLRFYKKVLAEENSRKRNNEIAETEQTLTAAKIQEFLKRRSAR